MANRKSDTMELNSILAEARTRRTGSSAPAQSSAQRRPASARPASAPRQTASSRPARSLNDDFIFTDDDGRVSAPARKNTRPASSYPQSRPKRKKKTGLIVTLCIIGIVLLAGVGGLTLYLNSGSGTGPQSTFSDNVYVNGKSLKGMTMEQARQLMSGVETSLADGIKVEVKAGDKSFTYTKDDFEYSFDTEDVLNQAKAYSEDKGIKTEKKEYEIKMTLSDATCADIISAVSGEVNTEAKNATVTSFDTSASSMFTVSDGATGVSVDEQASLTALTDFIKQGNVSGTVTATVSEVEPEYSAEYLKSNITKLSSFSTISSNNSNGNSNMALSLSACDGSIIEPGATWSFNDCTGNSNLESNGYKPAGVIVNGKSETGVGGGICQSSTTIYNAAILCGMQVVERQCHYYKSVYVDAGRDATVDYGNIDLKVSNPFKYQLFMKCWMDGTQLNCEIYGLPNAEFDDIDISTTSPSYFSNGYTVYSTRTYYKNGAEVKSDDLPSSTYYTSAPSSSSDSDSSGSSSSDNSGSNDTSYSDPVDTDTGSDTGGDSGYEGGESGGGEEGGGESGGDESGGEGSEE